MLSENDGSAQLISVRYSSRNGLLDESTQLKVFKEASYSVIDI